MIRADGGAQHRDCPFPWPTTALQWPYKVHQSPAPLLRAAASTHLPARRMERDRRDGLVSRADHDTGGGQRLDAAGHAVERVIQEIGGHLHRSKGGHMVWLDEAAARCT
eukprot:86396-Chlamydomonas_euryale.AAC.12